MIENEIITAWKEHKDLWKLAALMLLVVFVANILAIYTANKVI